MLGDDARERYGQVIAQGKVGFARRLVLATAKDLENELVPLLAVLAGQRLDILERGRLERLESVALIHVLDDPDHVIAPPDVFREKVPHAAGGARRLRHQACM